jgi:hypothetical protein
LKIILSFLPTHQRLLALKVTDNHGLTVLHKASANPQSLETILSHLTEDECLLAVKQKDNYGHTVLHKASSRPESIEILLSYVQEERRLEVVREKDKNGHTVLQRSFANPVSLKNILSNLRGDERLVAVQEKDSCGHTVLYSASGIPAFFEIILSLLSKKDHIAAVQGMNKQGKVLLDLVHSNHEYLKHDLPFLNEILSTLNDIKETGFGESDVLMNEYINKQKEIINSASSLEELKQIKRTLDYILKGITKNIEAVNEVASSFGAQSSCFFKSKANSMTVAMSEVSIEERANHSSPTELNTRSESISLSSLARQASDRINP